MGKITDAILQLIRFKVVKCPSCGHKKNRKNEGIVRETCASGNLQYCCRYCDHWFGKSGVIGAIKDSYRCEYCKFNTHHISKCEKHEKIRKCPDFVIADRFKAEL